MISAASALSCRSSAGSSSSRWGWLLLGLMLLRVAHAMPTMADSLKEVSLPDGYKPEGVAQGWGDNVYVGSLLSKVVKVNIKTGSTTDVLTAADLALGGSTLARPVTGLKVSVRARLMVIAGGTSGGAWAVKLGADGLVNRAAPNSIQFFALASNPAASLVNDVALREGGEGCKRLKKRGKPGLVAYFTDSFANCIYQLECSSSGECSRTATFTDPAFVPLAAAAGGVFSTLSLNGIVADPLPVDTLLVGSTSQAVLFKVVITGTASIAVTRVNITEGGNPVLALATDGLLPDGKRGLFGVEVGASSGAVTQLVFSSANYTSAAVVQRFTDPALAGPSTIARAGGHLYVVNARFASCPVFSPCPAVKFQLVRVAKN